MVQASRLKIWRSRLATQRALGVPHGRGVAGSVEQSTPHAGCCSSSSLFSSVISRAFLSPRSSLGCLALAGEHSRKARLLCAPCWLWLLHLSAPASRGSFVLQLGHLLGRPCDSASVLVFLGLLFAFTAALRDPAPSTLRLSPHTAALAASGAQGTAPGDASTPWLLIRASLVCMCATLTSVLCVAQCRRIDALSHTAVALRSHRAPMRL